MEQAVSPIQDLENPWALQKGHDTSLQLTTKYHSPKNVPWYHPKSYE